MNANPRAENITVPRESLFTLLLPPGWVRIPVDSETEGWFDDVIGGIVSAAPAARRSDLRVMLEASVRDSLASAKSQGALDLVLSFAEVEGLPLPVSIVVSILDVPTEYGGSVQEQLLTMANPSARAIEIDGLIGLRRFKDRPQDAGAPARRTVSYIVHLPWRGDWLVFTASILTTDEPGYADVQVALEALIDAMISTVRFPRRVGSA